jgi:hypothetical protein
MPLLQSLKAAGTGQGAKTYYFRGIAVDYPASVQALLGVVPTPAAEQDEPVYKLEELLGKGKLIRINVRYGTGANKKVAKLVCLRENLATALDGLVGVTYKNSLIVSAHIPLKDQFF